MNIEYKEITEIKELKKLIEEVIKPVFEEEGEVDILTNDVWTKSNKKDKNIVLAAIDTDKNKYIGTVSLIDTPMKYDGIEIKTCELGVVGTLEEYRGNKINDTLTKLFLEKAEELEYDMIIIEGIPYFYRRYGFNYSVPMSSESFKINNLEFTNKEKLTMRKADKKDLNFIKTEFDKSNEKVEIYLNKEKEIIDNHMNDYEERFLAKDYRIIEKEGKKIGYLALTKFKDIMQICEISDDLNFDVYESVLSILEKELDNYKTKDEIRLDIPETNKLIAFSRSKGSKRIGDYQWQIKILNLYRFMENIKPVLEKRIKNSIYNNENFKFKYHNYREMIEFNIKNSKINIKKLKFEPAYDVNIPPQAEVKYLLGNNTYEELRNILPDTIIQKKFLGLMNTMFPKTTRHFYHNY
ncbi:MAG: GNAT family N-acetyltransferase [Thermotogota bacterium]